MFSEYELTKADIVFVGDSITSKCDYSEFFPHMATANRGIGSDTSEGVLNRLDSVANLNPDYCVILIGINDIGYDIPMESTANNVQNILYSLRDRLPDMRIMLLSVLPCESKSIDNQDIQELNAQYKRLADGMANAVYIDLYTAFEGKTKELLSHDGVHLNGQGYRVLVDAINQQLR